MSSTVSPRIYSSELINCKYSSFESFRRKLSTIFKPKYPCIASIVDTTFFHDSSLITDQTPNIYEKIMNRPMKMWRISDERCADLNCATHNGANIQV